MKELVKPNHVEARYQEVQGYQVDLELRCGVDGSCEERNRCRRQNAADAEVMDEILF